MCLHIHDFKLVECLHYVQILLQCELEQALSDACL